MIAIICMLIPAMLSLAIWEKYTQKTTNALIYFKKLAVHVLAINLMIMLTYIVIGMGHDSLGSHSFSPFYSIRFLLLSGFYACLFPWCAFRLRNYLFTSSQQVQHHRFIYYFIGSFFLFLGLLLFFATKWAFRTFGNITFEKVVFALTTPLKGTGSDIITSYILQGLLPPILILIAVLFFVLVCFKKPRTINIKWCKRKYTIYNFPRNQLKKYFVFFCLLIFISSCTYSFNTMKVRAYLKYITEDSNFIKTNYVDPRNVTITFPEEKQNLIYIFMESMESSFTAQEYGGAVEVDLIPELRSLAENNTHFSNTGNLGGMISLPSTDWTMAGMTAQHAGMPLKVALADKNDISQFEGFLPGLYSLGEILEEQGYNQSVMMGSDAVFGGRANFYSQHGNYNIYDYFTAQEDGIIPEEYHEWWGFEDAKLYEYAKQELTSLSQEEEPFAFVMLTADTHFEAGYLCELCGTDHNDQYENVISCADQQISQFMKWLKQQDYYENTTIVIVGDHISMDVGFAQRHIEEGYTRTVYNTIINGQSETERSTFRSFSAFDMFPTTLAALGATIEGEQLGLGVNLYSNTETLLEKYGVDPVREELNYRSSFYNNHILKQKQK